VLNVKLRPALKRPLNSSSVLPLHPLRVALPLPVAPLRLQAVVPAQQGVVAASVAVPTLPAWLKELNRAVESLAKRSKRAMIASRSTPDSQKPVPAAVFGWNRVS
jgi:hypothetical protein